MISGPFISDFLFHVKYAGGESVQASERIRKHSIARSENSERVVQGVVELCRSLFPAAGIDGLPLELYGGPGHRIVFYCSNAANRRKYPLTKQLYGSIITQ